MTMMSMNRRISICSTMAITKATHIHGQARVRLDDFVVIVSQGFREGLSAVGVVASFAGVTR
jgi:hypothetical protein